MEVLEVIRDGTVNADIRRIDLLAEAAHIHQDLEGRLTVVSIAMVP